MLDFDNTVDEYADWACVMPRHYAGGGITLTIVWSAVPTVNDVSWACQIRREEDDSNQITGDFATAVVASASTTAGTARNLTYKTLAMTDGAQMDSVAVGEAFTLRIYRDISVTTTVIGDAELHKIEVQET